MDSLFNSDAFGFCLMSTTRNVYIGNISSKTRTRDLQKVLEKYGEVRRLDMKNGFAFVEFDDDRDGADCIDGLDGYELDGRKLAVEKTRDSRDKRGPKGGAGEAPGTGIKGGAVRGSRENCVIITGLNRHVKWTHLKDWAREAGEVEFSDVWNEAGKTQGVVKYKSREAVKRAIKDLDDTKLEGDYVRVYEDTFQKSDSRSRSRGRKKHSRSRSRSRSRSKGKDREKRKDSSPGRDKGGEGRDKGGEGRDKGGDVRDKRGDSRDKDERKDRDERKERENGKD